MKKTVLPALALLTALLWGCAPKAGTVADIAPQATEAQQATAAPAAPAAGYTLHERQVFYPEGSDEQSADYILSYTLPVFTGETAQAINDALALWESELLERVNTEQLPLSDRAEGEEAPYTEVTAEVLPAGGYTNILFTEAVSYGGEPMLAQSSIVLDGAGEEISLGAIAGLYAPEALVAQQVYNYIDAEDPARETYFGDLELADIELVMDLYNGFLVNEQGYELLFPMGVLASEAWGEQRIPVAAGSLHPDFVGEGEPLTHAEYERLLPALQKLATACGSEYRSFSGEPDALSYTLFMAQLFAAREAQNGVIIVPQADYEAAARDFFASVPADLTDGDGTALTDGAYRIPAAPHPSYGVRVDDCRASGEELTLSCMLYYGAPGSGDARELAPVTITLRRSGSGFLLTGFLFV